MSFYMLMLTKFESRDIFIPILITKGLIRNFKKHKDKTRISVKLGDFLGIFPNYYQHDIITYGLKYGTKC